MNFEIQVQRRNFETHKIFVFFNVICDAETPTVGLNTNKDFSILPT